MSKNIMKKQLVLLLCFTYIGICQAQHKKKVEVPAAAKTAFAAKFPGAQKVKWSIEKEGQFEAEFKVSGLETSCIMDSNGNLMETEVEIKLSELPETVKSALAKDFKDYKLNEIEKATDSKGVISYEFEAKKGKEKLEFVFDLGGKLLKKEANTGSDRD
jgi:hypothetical protein